MTEDVTHIDTGTEQLLCRIENGVAVITLNRPEARNALSEELSPALRRMIKERGEDDRVGALLLTGAGTAFCAGGDVKGMGDGMMKDAQSLAAKAEVLKDRQRTLTGALVAVRKPTIAALPGAAAGAGLAIALACDIRVAARSAFVTTAYARIGLTGDYGITWHLTRLVGTARARELMYTADRIDAERAEHLGLVNRVVDDGDLFSEAFALDASLAAGPRLALGLMKDNLDGALTADFLTSLDDEAERLVRAASTDDHKEAVRAFIEKRSPRFGGS